MVGRQHQNVTWALVPFVVVWETTMWCGFFPGNVAQKNSCISVTENKNVPLV